MLRNAYSNAESIKFVRLGITTKRPEYVHFNPNPVDWIGDMVMQALWRMCEFEACARVVLYEGQEHHSVSHIGTVRYREINVGRGKYGMLRAVTSATTWDTGLR